MLKADHHSNNNKLTDYSDGNSFERNFSAALVED